MKCFWSLVATSVIFSLLSPLALHAAYQIKNDLCSPVGGVWDKTGLSNTIISSNMQPYSELTSGDMDVLFDKAYGYYQDGRTFMENVSFYSCDPAPCGDPRLDTLLTDPSANFESVGFVSEFRSGGLEANLKSAIDYFSYLLKSGYSGNAQQYLNETLEQLVTIYTVFADEFLIDALDFRFSATALNMDAYLDEQLAQLEKAIAYYQEGADAFISTWAEPIGWSDEVIGQYLDQDAWETFGLLFQRLTVTLRERGTRQRVRLTTPEAEIKEHLTEWIAALYIQLSAMSQTLGADFIAFGGDQLKTAINVLGKQLGNLKAGLNPLGYDVRYVPLNTYEDLYSMAQTLKTTCTALETEVNQEIRDFDYLEDKIVEQQNSLYTSYAAQLADLTGCPLPLDSQNQTQLDEFMLCVECAGGDLYDCSIDMEVDAFNACVGSKPSGSSILAAKYRQIKDSDLALERARLQFDNISKEMRYKNAQTNYQIQIWKDYIGDKKEALSDYQDKLMNSCTIRKVKTEIKVKDRDTGEITRQKESRTEKTFRLDDEELEINTEHEKELLDIELTFQIKNALDDTDIKNLLLQQADALLGIDMAVNNKNSMIAAFDAAMRQKEDTLRLWRQNLDFYNRYWVERLPNRRVIRSNKIITLANYFNELAHYAHLATKALEYKFMEELDGVDLPGGAILNAPDLFKCQTVTDFDTYLLRLNQYETMNRDSTYFLTSDPFRFSVTYDLLGLTNANLGDLNNDGYVDVDGRLVSAVRFERFQQFVNEHIDGDGNLTFSFNTSVYDKVLGNPPRANLKIWYGEVPYRSSELCQGFSAGIFFKGSPGSIYPQIYIAQKGTHTFKRTNSDIADYYPVKIRALLLKNDTSPQPFNYDQFTPFIDVDPRFVTTPPPMGTWIASFSNRSVAATEWIITLKRAPKESGEWIQTPFHKLRDICFYFDTISNNFDIAGTAESDQEADTDGSN